MNTKPDKFFTTQLMSWHEISNERSLPWKKEKDPYKIWLSEIILQQTRAQQGLPYYLRLTEAYPTVAHMAAAHDDDVFRLWQGLGYYNRCKNMLATARHITSHLNGAFPADHEQLLQLKGIGAYTAAAIASFAFGLPHAVVDGNVYRVLARYFAVDKPFDTTSGKKVFAELAQQLLDTNNSAAYNQAIMDFGATVCTPRAPLCDHCPLQKKCKAHKAGAIDLFPVRSKKQTVTSRYFHYLLLHWKDTLWVHKRIEKDIWENLHQPYLIESSYPLKLDELLKNELFKKLNLDYSEITEAGHSAQRLTHQQINARFVIIKLKKKVKIDNTSGIWLNSSELKKTAFPKTIISFFENNLYF
jgi:A/G-specific adenine glycosylase